MPDLKVLCLKNYSTLSDVTLAIQTKCCPDADESLVAVIAENNSDLKNFPTLSNRTMGYGPSGNHHENYQLKATAFQ